MSGTEEHRHCKVCGKVCNEDQETCSAKCRTEWERRRSSRRSNMRLMYALIAVVLLLFLASLVHF